MISNNISDTLTTVTTFLKQHPNIALGLTIYGGWSLAAIALNFLQFLYQTFLESGLSLKKFGAKKGRWAVVTGATDGIGLEFAFQLSKAGFNVFLASRSEDKLASLAKDIESRFNVQTKYHAIDFSKRDPAAYAKLAEALSSVDVGVLVNNVGKSHVMPVYFDEADPQEVNDILEINIHATLEVTRIVLPLMLNKKNGLILTMGSFVGMVPSPMLAPYSGTKAFLSTWTQALAEEYASRGIIAQYVNTYFVTSRMSKIRRPTMLIPTPKAYVATVLRKIGVPCGSPGTATSTPYWSHSLIVLLIGAISAWIPIKYTHNLHIDIRRRALKKREREAAAAAKAQ